MTPIRKTTARKAALAALAAVLGGGALAALPALAQDAPRGGPPHGPARLFQDADANRDGRVGADEAWNALSARFAEADANKDGGVTMDEFRAYTQAQMQARRGDRPAPPPQRVARMEERGQGMFRALDADRDGRVTLTELRPFAEAMFRARDTNGDNALTREEIRPHHARAERPRDRDRPAPTTPQ